MESGLSSADRGRFLLFQSPHYFCRSKRTPSRADPCKIPSMLPGKSENALKADRPSRVPVRFDGAANNQCTKKKKRNKEECEGEAARYAYTLLRNPPRATLKHKTLPSTRANTTGSSYVSTHAAAQRRAHTQARSVQRAKASQHVIREQSSSKWVQPTWAAPAVRCSRDRAAGEPGSLTDAFSLLPGDETGQIPSQQLPKLSPPPLCVPVFPPRRIIKSRRGKDNNIDGRTAKEQRGGVSKR